MNIAVVRAYRDRARWRPVVTSADLVSTAISVLVAIGLFKLAISDGGRDPRVLTVFQTAVFAATAFCVWSGMIRRAAVLTPLIVMAAAVAVAAVGSVRPDSSARELLLWMTYACLFILVVSTLNGREAARRFLDALVFIVGWVALVGFYLFWGANNPGMRWYSTFYWPNPFAAFLLLVIPLELSRLVHARAWRETLTHGAMVVLLCVPFVLTYSRGAWVTLLLVVLASFALFRPSSRVGALARLGATAVVVMAVVILLTHGAALESSPQAVLGRAVSVANANDNSIQARLHFWRGGLEMFFDRPLLGTGPGTFAYVYSAYQRDVRHYARDAHSLYVQTVAEMGVIGLLALSALLVSLLALGVRTLRRARGTSDYPLVAGMCAGLGAFLLHSALEMNWPFPANPAVAFSIVAVLVVFDRPLPEDAPVQAARTGATGWWRWPAVAILLLAVVGVQLLQAEQQKLLAAKGQLSARRWAEAATTLRLASKLNPLDPKAPSGLAVARDRLGADRREVVGLIRRSMTLDSMNAYYAVQLAQFIYRREGEDPSSRALVMRLVEQALTLDPYHYPNMYGLKAQLLAEAGQTQQAERVYQDARSRYGRAVTEDGVLRMMLWPGVARLYMEQARFLAAQARPADAAVVYKDVIELDPRYVGAYVEGADLFLRQRHANDALALLARGLTNAPGSEVLWQKWRALSVRHGGVWEQ